MPSYRTRPLLATYPRPTHPGEMLLKEFIEPNGLTPADVAVRCGIEEHLLHAVIAGKASVTKDAALRFERLFGMRAGFWLTLQAHWDVCSSVRWRQPMGRAEL